MANVTLGMNFAQIKSAIESTTSGTVNIEQGIYNLTTSYTAEILVNSNVTINGNNAEFRVYGATRNDALNNYSQRLYIRCYGSNSKINNLTLHGRCSVYLRGSGHTLTRVIVDQSNRYTSYSDLKYNRLDSMYACIRINGSSSNITFDHCETWYADHMGIAIFIDSNATGTHYNIRYLYCKFMHCGSGWEIDGNNPWGRGLDVAESQGTFTFYAEGCCAYDCLQSGFYNEGNYGGHSQTCTGEYKNCHAENNGIRIANADITGQPLIVGTKNYYTPSDVYGDGYYCMGSGITVTNCTSKNNIIGFTSETAKCNGFQDEGSYIGAMCSGTILNNFISKSAKLFAVVSWNSLSGTIKIIDFNSSGRPPMVHNWFTRPGQIKIAPRSYKDMWVNNGAVRLTSGALATTYCRFTRTRCSTTDSGVYNTSPSNLSIRVNSTNYDTFSDCVKGWYGSSASSSGTSVSFFTPTSADMIAMPTTGCGGGVIPPPNPVCGSVDCAAKKKYVCDASGNGSWQTITTSDPDYIARCITAECTGSELICNDGKEYQCSNGTLVATGKTCVGTSLSPFPGVPIPVLQKGTVAKIYARDFALGGRGVAYSDTSTGTESGYSAYRADSGDVDLVNWDARLTDPEPIKVVVAYTATGEWLKYPVNVTHCGTYKVQLRVSSGQSTGKVRVSVDDHVAGVANVPFTSSDYATFTTIETNVVVPHTGSLRTVTLEFEGDMNVLWFSFEHTSDSGCEADEDPGGPIIVDRTQQPYNVYNIRNEYGFDCKINADEYDYGGEGKAYHNVETSRAGTYRRGVDTLELLDHGIVTSTGEWVEYTVNVSESNQYYFSITTSNVNKTGARLRASVVNPYGVTTHPLFDVGIPITGGTYLTSFIDVSGVKKFFLPKGDGVVIRFQFTDEFVFKTFNIVPSATYEGHVSSRPYRAIDIAALPQTIKPYEFDYGGPGISYIDRSEERFIQKPIRDSDVDVISIGKSDNTTQSVISNTMKGEWVQYTFQNTMSQTSTSLSLRLDISCSTTDAMSKMMIVFENENPLYTVDATGRLINRYIVRPPIVNNFTELHNIIVPVVVYKGKNTMRIYFDDNITLGEMVFKA